MEQAFQDYLKEQLSGIRSAGTYKNGTRDHYPREGATIRVADGSRCLIFAQTIISGLAQHPAVAEAAKEAIDRWGYGTASVRFICGTQSVHNNSKPSSPSSRTGLSRLLSRTNSGSFEPLLGFRGQCLRSHSVGLLSPRCAALSSKDASRP